MKILIIICIALLIIVAFLIYIIWNQYSEHNEIKKENKKLNENAENTAEIISNANKTKADARTGDHSADIKYMADKLHDYAKK